MNTSNIPFKKQLQEDMKTALRAQEKERLGVIRLILAALKQAEIDEGLETETMLANDPRILRILDKMRKQRQDSIQQYEHAQRADLAEQERFEESVICSYLPAPLSIEEVDQLIKQVIDDSGATQLSDLKKVLEVIKPKVQGRADLRAISEKVKSMLS
jgi:uncharacterized protein